MQLRSAGWSAAVVIAAFIGAAIAIRLAWIYATSAAVEPGQGDLDRFTAFSTATAAIGSIFAFVVLIIYTRETLLLRRTSERQLEATYRPILVFSLASADSDLGQSMKLQAPHIANVGLGPAFQVTIQTMKGRDGEEVEFRLPSGPYVEAYTQVQLEAHILQYGQATGMSRSLSLLADLFQRGTFPEEMTVCVKCDSVSDKEYRTYHRVHYDATIHLVRTSVVGAVEV